MKNNAGNKTRCPLSTVFLLLIFSTSLVAIDLESRFQVPLKNNERVLGSLTGNFLVYGRPAITLYNESGKAVFSRKLKNNIKPVLSPGGDFLGLITYADHSPTELKTLKLELYDQAGQFLWKISKPVPNTFFIADNGTIFGIDGVEGVSPARLYVFDQYGDMVNIGPLLDYHGLTVAPSGRKLIIDKAGNGLDVYDASANFLSSLPACAKYIFDRDDRYIATFSAGVFRLYQDEKEVVNIGSSEKSIRDMDINVEENLCVLIAPKRLEVYELTTKKLLWEYRLEEPTKWFTAVDISDDGQFIACGVDINGGKGVPKDKRHVEGRLLIFSRDKTSVYSHEEFYKIWAAGLPRAVFCGSTGCLVLQTREKLEKFLITPGQ